MPSPETPPARAKPLTVKQQRFVDEYLVDLNATKAYQRVYGCSVKVADANGSRLLANARVASAVYNAAKAQSERTQITADVILGELLRIARVDIGEAFDDDGNLKPIKDIPEDVRRAIAGIEINELFEGKGEEREFVGLVKKVKFWDKKGSLELLGKHLKLFTDKLEISADESLAALIANTPRKA